MKKKTIAVLLALIAVLCCVQPAAALQKTGVIRVRLTSDISGLTENNVEKLIELKTDNVVTRVEHGGAFSIADYGGSPAPGPFVAGRTYYFHYMLQAADGYELPEALSDGDVEIECGKGVTVINTSITYGHYRLDDGTYDDTRGLMIHAKVVVDGNAIQRVVGVIYDIILKIRAWSLY